MNSDHSVEQTSLSNRSSFDPKPRRRLELFGESKRGGKDGGLVCRLRSPLEHAPGRVNSEWRVCRVGVDDHIDVDGYFCSVPYRFARAEVDARLTARGVEIFHKGERIAVHVRRSGAVLLTGAASLALTVAPALC